MSDFDLEPIEGDGLISIHARERRKRIREVFANSFSRILADKGLTQKELSKLVGIPEYEMSRYALGKSTPKHTKVQAIATALDIDPDALVPGYVSKGKDTGMRVNMRELDSGNLWIEFAGAFDRETAHEMIAVMSKNKIDKAPGR